MALPYYTMYNDEGNGYFTGGVRILVNDELYDATGILASDSAPTFEDCCFITNNILGIDSKYFIMPFNPLCTVYNKNSNDVTIYDYFNEIVDSQNWARLCFIDTLGMSSPKENSYLNELFKWGLYPSNYYVNQVASSRYVSIGCNYWGSSHDNSTYYQKIHLSNANNWLAIVLLGQYRDINTVDKTRPLNYSVSWRMLPHSAIDSMGYIIKSNSIEIKRIGVTIYASGTGYAYQVSVDSTTTGRMYTSALDNAYLVGASDPLSGGGYSGGSNIGEPGVQPDGTNAGGDGTFTLQSDDVPESPLPPASSSLIAASCGTVYCDEGSNIRSLMNYMWTHADDIIANLKKIIANPIDSILGLHIVPVVPNIGIATQVHLGNVGTGVNMTPVANPYLRYRMGSLVINKYWGSALDFSPFTQFNIHLPYIGFRQLNTDDLMGSTVELYYDIDVISGACVAHLKVTRTDPLTKEIHTVDQYSWAGNCAMQIPVTSTNYQSLYSFIFNSAVSVGMAFATGAAGMVGGTMTAGQYAATIGQSLSTTANNLFNGGSKIRVEKSGNVSGAHGFLDSQYAYIERVTPRQSLASNYREVLGYPSNTTQVLGTCTGFTQIEDINLENFSCTADEKNELERLLKGGVIF